jgi:hypothetical protein
MVCESLIDLVGVILISWGVLFVIGNVVSSSQQKEEKKLQDCIQVLYSST